MVAEGPGCEWGMVENAKMEVCTNIPIKTNKHVTVWKGARFDFCLGG